MAFIKNRNIDYDFVFSISSNLGGCPHVHRQIPPGYYPAAVCTWLGPAPGPRVGERGLNNRILGSLVGTRTPRRRYQ